MQTPRIEREALLTQLEEKGFTLNQLKACEAKINMLPQGGFEAEFLGALKRLEVVGREQKMEKLILKAKNSELSEDEKKALKEFLQSRESIG